MTNQKGQEADGSSLLQFPWHLPGAVAGLCAQEPNSDTMPWPSHPGGPAAAPDPAAEARAQAADHVRLGDFAYAQGDLAAALDHYLAAVPLAPQDAALQCRVGDCLARLGHADAAIQHFNQATRFDPHLAHPHQGLAQLHLENGRIEQALQHARRAMDLAPNSREAALQMAWVLEADQQVDATWQIVARLLASGSEPGLLGLFARMAGRLRQEGEALAAIERRLRDPSELATRDACALHFAAANLLDKLGRYDEAFAHAQQANALRRAPYDSSRFERHVAETIGYFSGQKLAQLPRATHGSDVPVFIVGMPRSGTTLTEQILCSHPQVHGAGERDWILRAAEGAIQRCWNNTPTFLPHCLDRLSQAHVDELARAYLDRLLPLAPGAKRITDKLPGNCLHLGLIAMLFPQARVIHCRRNALDTCLSCYFTDFATPHEFCADFDRLAGHYRLYARLMPHWRKVLPIPMLEVDYEQLVADTPGQIRRMLEFLQLPWDDRCLRFHENRRLVTTASIEQVRRPIYHSSVGRWRHYAKHLAPLQAALADIG